MSIDSKMAWRNIWRNPRRTLLTIAAIAFAVGLLIFMLSMQFGSYESMINYAVKVQTGHIQVLRKGYPENRDIHKVIPDPGKIGKIMENIPEITAFSYRGLAFSLISSRDRTYGAAVMGIDPETEAKVSRIRSLVKKGEFLSPEDREQALVGYLLARNLKVDVGDDITVIGQGRDGSVAATVLTVKGLFRSGQNEYDRSAIHMPLSYFREVYFMRGAIHKVVGVCDSLWDVGDAKKSIKNALEKTDLKKPLVVKDWNDLMPGLLQSIKMDLVSGIIFYILLIILVAFSILNTFLMAIFERTREFGVMMAVGTTPKRLMKLLLTESIFMTAVGIAAGIVLGVGFTLYFETRGLAIGSSEILKQFGIPGKIYPMLTIPSLVAGPVLVFIITILAALYPTLKVRKLKPVEAMTFT